MENSKEDSSSSEISSSSISFDASERMLNFLLRDYLAKHLPPNFDSRILNRLKARESGVVEPPMVGRNAPSFTQDELDEALGAAQADVEFGKSEGSLRTAPPKQIRSKPADVSWLDFVWVRRLGTLAVLAASVGLVYFGGRHLLTLVADSGLANSAPTVVEGALANGEPANPSSEDISTPAQPPTESSVAKVLPPDSPQSINAVPKEDQLASAAMVEKNPTSVTESQPTDRSTNITSQPMLAQPITMERNEFHSVVNHQLSHMWDRLVTTPKLSQDLDQWLDRVTESAIGRLPTSAERQAFRNRKEDSRLDETVRDLVESDEFNIHWASIIAEQYLGGPLPSANNRNLEMIQFVDWIEEQLRQKKTIGSWERSLVDRRMGAKESQNASTPNDSTPVDAALFWFSDRMRTALVIVDEIDMFTKAKLHHSSKDAVAVSLARSLIHQSGNGMAACSQCHEPSFLSSKSWGAEAKPELSNSFWGVSAAFAQLASRNNSEKQPIANELFYEASDGRMLIAKPKIAVDENPSNALSLADWIEYSTDARYGMVEALWTKVVQQPLVPAFGLEEDEGALERRDLKDLFARQLQATGDVRKVVEAILLSDVMKVQTASITSAWYLKSPLETLAKYNQGKRVFAFAPNNVSRSYFSSRTSSNQVAKWLEVGRDKDSGTLAQPDARRIPNYGAKKNANVWSDDQLRFMVSVDKPYSRLEKMAQSLGQSNLVWDDKVNHAYLTVLGRFPTRSERNEAKEFLDLAGQNNEKAIIYIVTSKLGSW